MDTKVTDGDHGLSSGGVPLRIDGPEAWAQRAMLRLQAVQGAFCYDRTFGGCLHTLTAAHGETQWLAAAQEALLPEADLQVTAAEKGEGQCIFTLETPEGTVQVSFPIKEDENGDI